MRLISGRIALTLSTSVVCAQSRELRGRSRKAAVKHADTGTNAGTNAG